MSPIVSIIFCDSIQNNFINGKPTPVISRPLKAITPYNLPGNFTFSIYCSIEGIKTDKKHWFRIEVKDTKNATILSTSNAELPMTPDVVELPMIEFAADLRNVVLLDSGDITAIVYVDDEKCGEEILKVIKREDINNG